MNHHTALSLADEMLARNGLAETIGAATFFAGDLPHLDELRARVAERWAGQTRLGLVLDPPPDGYRRLIRRHRWAVTEGFAPADHVLPVVEAVAPNVRDQAGDPMATLGKLLTAQLCRPMPVGLPPWRLLPVRGVPDGGFALVLLSHHALLDGASLETLFRLLLDGTTMPTVGTSSPAPHARTPRRPTDRAGLARTVRAELRRGGALPGTLEGDAHPEVALAVLDQENVRAARGLADGSGATLIELLTCLTAGALRSLYGPTGTAGRRRSVPVQAAVPVNLRTQENAQQLGNIVSTVRFPLPLHAPTPQARLTACRGRLAEVPRGTAQQDLIRFGEAVNRLGPWALGAIAARGYSPAYAAVSTTALKWRHPQSSLGNRPLLNAAGLPPLHQPGTLSLVAVACGRTVTLSVVTHTGRGTARTLADAVSRELTLMAGKT